LTDTSAPIQVVLVDDDTAVHGGVNRALAAATDIQLAAAFMDARSAIDWLKDNRTDVLLVDLGLPDMSGLAVITYCAQKHVGTDIMVISVFDDADKVVQSIKAGASGYLLKDSLHDQLPALIRQLRAGGAPMTPSIARKVLNHVRPADAPAPAVAAAPAAPARGGHGPAGFAEFRLTPAEDNVLQYVARGFKYAEIAQLTGVSIHTVHSHIKNIYAKLSVNSRSEAVFEASRLGLLDSVFPAAGTAR
jgi:DNA-binding NarL/FixJ family response regulator